MMRIAYDTAIENNIFANNYIYRYVLLTMKEYNRKITHFIQLQFFPLRQWNWNNTEEFYVRIIIVNIRIFVLYIENRLLI